MIEKKLQLSENGSKILKESVRKSLEDMGKYGGKIRTTFFYLNEGMKSVEHIELRDYIEQIMKENKLELPFDRKESDYFLFVNTKFFNVLSVQLHRQHPNCYLVATQKEDGRVIFIIRDADVWPASNMKITWNDSGLKDGKTDPVDFHLSKSQLD